MNQKKNPKLFSINGGIMKRFTLIELMIVLAIFLMLASVIIPALFGNKRIVPTHMMENIAEWVEEVPELRSFVEARLPEEISFGEYTEIQEEYDRVKRGQAKARISGKKAETKEVKDAKTTFD